MSAIFKKVIENIGQLTSAEKAQMAHCLIASLEVVDDDCVDEAWADLAVKRFDELSSGAVEGVSWESIKNKIKT